MDNRMYPETSRRNPVGIQSHPVESGQQPEASLASSVMRPVAKRRQRRCRAMPLSPEISVAGAHAVSCSGGRAVASYWPDADGPAGVAGTWRAPTGVPQEQERPAFPRETNRLLGGAEPKRPGPRLRAVDRWERTNAAQLAVPPSEPNERGGKDWQGSECLHSTETRLAIPGWPGDKWRAN